MTCRSLSRILHSVVCLALLLQGALMRTAITHADDAKTTDVAKTDQKGDEGAKNESSKNDETKKGDKRSDRYLAITGATVHTVTGSVLQGPTLLCKNGRIVAIGHDVAIPEDTEMIDAAGFHVYPGLVAVRSRGLIGREPPEDNTDLYSLAMTLGLSGGVTTVVSGNTAGKLTFGTLEGHVLRRNLFTTLRYTTRDPDGRRKFRATLERVRQYRRGLEAYEMKKKHDPKAKAPDKTWLKDQYETARKLLEHETVAITDANTAAELHALATLAEQYGIRLVVRGATEGWIEAPAMARAGMRTIITPRTRRDIDKRTNHANGSSIENARILHEHGVPFAIIPAQTGVSTSGLAGRDLWQLAMEAAFAVRGGLSNEAALRAITIDAARILGIDHRVGSIEIGKDADFAIVNGDLLHYMTLVRWTVVNGRIVYDKEKDSLLNHIRPGGDRNAPPPADHWPRRLGQPW